MKLLRHLVFTNRKIMCDGKEHLTFNSEGKIICRWDCFCNIETVIKSEPMTNFNPLDWHRDQAAQRGELTWTGD